MGGGGKVLINFLNCKKKKLLRFYSLKEVEKIKMKICKKKKTETKKLGGGGLKIVKNGRNSCKEKKPNNNTKQTKNKLAEESTRRFSGRF